LVARAIYYLRARRDFPFIPANCGALFLDEMDTLSHKGQVALVGIPQYQEYKPVKAELSPKRTFGSPRHPCVDVQLATELGTLRSNLFLRLNIEKFVLPPLCEGGADIAIPAKHFV
jgi:DNA-binding NtrC family response regulator